jgi:acetyl esterase/lipase
MNLASARLAARSVLFAALAFSFTGQLLAQQISAAAKEEVVRVHAGVAALGRNWNASVLAETAKLYAPMHRQRDLSGIKQLRDLHYGKHGKQKLDLFVPEQEFSEPGPVFIFLHGGEATGGDKTLAGTGEQMFGNVARLAARVGGVGINADYRPVRKHADRASSPAGVDDIRELIDWTHHNIAQHGGDPKAIIVFALGDGAAHLAGYLFHQPSQLKEGPGIAGTILVSGTFGSVQERPLNLIDSYQGQAVPIMLWSAELDPVQSGIAEMKDLLCRKYGKCPMLAELSGHNHVSAVMSLDTADTSPMGYIHQFYHSAVRK